MDEEVTATDELCRMLAKMGVEYVLDEEYGKKYLPEQRVTWSCDIAGEDMTVTARDYCIGRDESGEWEYCLDLEFHEVFTPEQAIAATVGGDNSDTVKHLMKLQGGHYSWPMLYETVTGDPFDYDCPPSKSEEVFIEKLISIVGGRKVVDA